MRLLDGLTGDEVGRRERPGEGRDRLDRAAHDERLAVGHPAGQAAGVVRPVDPMAGLAAALDDVVDGRPEPPGLLEPEPELDALDDVDAHDRGRQRGVEAPIPVDVRAEPDGQPVDDDLEHAADRVAGRTCLVDAGDHRRLGVRVGAAQRRGVGLVARARRAGRIDGHATDLRRERPDLDAELAQEGPGHGPRRDPCRCLARGRSLEHVAHVVEAVLERAGEVGVAGPDAGDRRRPLVALVRRVGQLGRLLRAQRSDLHHPGPVLPIAVADEQEDRRSERPAVADPAEDLGPVLLDGLARPAAVAALATSQVDRDVVLGQGQAGRHALDRRPERRSVRLAGGQEPESGHSAAAAAGSVASAGAPVGSPSAERRPPARASASFDLHELERRRLARPQRERGRPLMEEHQLAVRSSSPRPPRRRAAGPSGRR